MLQKFVANQPNQAETYPADGFPTKDGDVVLVGFSAAIFRRICEVIGQPGLADPRFKANADRNAHEDELRRAIAAWAAELTQDQALARLRDADVPAGVVARRSPAKRPRAGTRHVAASPQRRTRRHPGDPTARAIQWRRAHVGHVGADLGREHRRGAEE
ncbi:MAG: CoA transferase [Xanthobacteraceae bacterium]|nr:CoA transferase [Xanthobacteraceae bacterium]